MVCVSLYSHTLNWLFVQLWIPPLSLCLPLTFSLSLSVTHIHSLLFILSRFSHAVLRFSGKLPFSTDFSFHDCGVASSSDTAEQKRSVLWLLGYRETQRISEELLSCMAFSIKELFKSSYCIICLEKTYFAMCCTAVVDFETDADSRSQTHVRFPVTLRLFYYKQSPL